MKRYSIVIYNMKGEEVERSGPYEDEGRARRECAALNDKLSYWEAKVEPS